MNAFWKNYQFLCRKNNESVYDVAKSCGVYSTSAVSYWRKGSTPKAETLQKLSEHFGISPSDLLHADLELDERNTFAATVALDDPLYAAIVKLTPEQRVLVKGFIAGLKANQDISL